VLFIFTFTCRPTKTLLWHAENHSTLSPSRKNEAKEEKKNKLKKKKKKNNDHKQQQQQNKKKFLYLGSSFLETTSLR